MGRHRLEAPPDGDARRSGRGRADTSARPGAGPRVTGRDLAAGSIGATAPVLAEALTRPPTRSATADRRGRGRPTPSRPRWTTPRRLVAAAGWAWVVVPFGWGLYELVVKIPSLFG